MAKACLKNLGTLSDDLCLFFPLPTTGVTFPRDIAGNKCKCRCPFDEDTVQPKHIQIVEIRVLTQ